MSPNIVPARGISDGPNLIIRLYDAAKAVKVHRKRLSGLARQCDSLLSTVREHSPRLVGTTAATEADEIERAIERILKRVLGWASYTDRVAFVRQNEIQLGIDECYHELTTCSDKFAIAMNILANSDNSFREEVRRRDNARLYDMMARILEEVRRDSRTLSSEVEPMVESLTLQQEQVIGTNIQQPSPQLVASPRSKDLSEKVSIVSQQADIEGCLMDFYLGEWNSDGEQVALGRLRDQSPASQMHFKEWVEAWVGLQHRNLLSLFGHVRIGDVTYSVSPWMGKGNIREYLKINPDADYLRLLSEVASGMEFLHENEIVHGDLCGKNVLINGDGKAIVCGSNLSGYLNSSSDMSRARWFAPERITSTSITSPTEKGDVWSFGSFCVEVFTGEDPYSSHADFYVPVLLSQGTSPADRGSTAGDISPKMWELMESCWQINPAERPSMSKIQFAIRGMLPPRDRQQSTFTVGNLDFPSVPTFLPPTIERRPIDASDSLSPPAPLPLPMINGALRFTEEPSLITPSSPPRPIGPLPDMKIPPRISNAASLAPTGPRLPTLLEDDDHSPDLSILTAQVSTPPQPLTTGRPKLPRLSTVPSLLTLYTNPRRQASDSSSSQSPSSTGESVTHTGKPSKRWPFPITRSRTTPAGVAGPQARPGSSSSGESVTHPELPPKPPTPSRSGTALVGASSNRQWVPVNPEVLDYMQTAANDIECLLRPAKDGSVSAGNLEGLVSRVITGTADSSRDDHFRAAFLTIYQLFATSERVFEILKRRFESTGLDPAHVGSRYLILLFIESWLKKGFEDVDHSCSSKIKEFVRVISDSEPERMEEHSESERMEEQAAAIVRLVDDPEYVRLRKPEGAPRLRREPAPRPPGVTPSDVAAALTVVEGARFESITYWDYVNFTRGQSDTRRIKVFNTVHDLVTAWVQKTILEPDYLDERMKVYEEWVHTAQTCFNLNNFSSASAIVVALTSSTIKGLVLTCESKVGRVLQTLCRDLVIGAYQNTLQQVGTTELIPWLDPHLSTLNVTFAHSDPIVEVDGRPLIDFWQCRELAEQIDYLIQFSPPRCPGTRQDVLAFVEYSLKSSTGDSASRGAAEARSAKLAGEERLMLEHRARMRSLGIPWSPQRRK